MTSAISTTGVRPPVAFALVLIVVAGGRDRRAAHQGGGARPDRLLRLHTHEAVLALEGPGAGMKDSTCALKAQFIFASLITY